MAQATAQLLSWHLSRGENVLMQPFSPVAEVWAGAPAQTIIIKLKPACLTVTPATIQALLQCLAPHFALPARSAQSELSKLESHFIRQHMALALGGKALHHNGVPGARLLHPQRQPDIHASF